jgi:hypothetical protein
MKSQLLKIKNGTNFINLFVVTYGLTTKTDDIKIKIAKGISCKLKDLKSVEHISTSILVFPDFGLKKLSRIKGSGGADMKYTFKLIYNDNSQEELDLYSHPLDVY